MVVNKELFPWFDGIAASIINTDVNLGASENVKEQILHMHICRCSAACIFSARL
jgi:hypothetical protein